jgi:hypothetical protein
MKLQNAVKGMYLPQRGPLGYANPVAVIWVLITNQTVSFEAMLRKKPSLIRGIPKPIRRILRAFTTLQNLIIYLETDERSAFAVFARSNHHAHALDFTPSSSSGVRAVYAFLEWVVRNDSQAIHLRDASMFSTRKTQSKSIGRDQCERPAAHSHILAKVW